MGGFGSLGSLGELFPDQEVRCINPRCRDTWTWFKKKNDDPSRPPRKLCPKCEAKLTSLSEKEMSCKDESCDKVWTMTAKEQLYAKPEHLKESYCNSCAKKNNEAKNIEVPCRIKECKNTWIWTDFAQKKGNKKTPPNRMCESCHEEQKKLKDISIDCKISACDEKYIYTPLMQLYDLKSGHPADYRPRRMCKKCMDGLQKYKSITVPCKINSCKHTWEFSSYAQLEYYAKEGADAALPNKMCKECFQVFKEAKDEEIKCKNKGCDKTWKYTKHMAITDKLSGKKTTHRMCHSCFDKYNAIKDVELPCQYKKYGCEETSTLGRYPQLIAQLNNKPDRAYQLCKSCLEFISKAQTISKKCTACESEISFTPHEQLLEKLGKFTPSDHCPTCLGKEIKEATGNSELHIIHHSHVVKLPAKGDWNNDRAISAPPVFITHTKLDELVDTEVVITVFSDEFALADEEENSWPYKLEQLLRERHPEFKTVVLNSSIANTSSKQALDRVKRDVAPFKSNIIIFSFDHHNAMVKQVRGDKGFQPLHDSKEVTESTDILFAEIAKNEEGHKAYITTTPAIPAYHPPEAIHKGQLDEWESQQKAHFHKCLAHSRSAARKNDIAIIDVASRFEVNGEDSAKKWMKDWFNPNDHGLRNIINWAADFVESTGIYE